MDPPFDGLGFGHIPGGSNAIELPFRHRKHDAKDQFACRGSEIKAVLDADEGPARGAKTFDGGKAVDERPTEAIELCDDDAVRNPRLDTRKGLHEERPVSTSTGFIELLEYLAEGRTVQLGPALNLLSLHCRRDESGTTAAADLRHADITINEHSGASL